MYNLLILIGLDNTMRMHTLTAWNGLWAALAMLILAGTMNPTTFSGNDPASLSEAGFHHVPAPSLAMPNPALKPKSLKVWECVAGWYGEPFDGQPTATGEIYDMYAETAAHRTLPLGSLVRVENLRTRRSVVVRINDRGPYVAGRGLDVSYEVAEKLGFAKRGLARVRLELLEVPRRPKAPNPGN